MHSKILTRLHKGGNKKVVEKSWVGNLTGEKTPINKAIYPYYKGEN